MKILELFQKGDVYLDFPYEDMKFRFEKKSGRVFAKIHGCSENEISFSNKNFNEAISLGKIIEMSDYFLED